ncbi:nuclear transport factor 2 family protein [Streptomyces asoensis]|uniref:nuclear transport factor 2 family protein n=1 Tax=Streptomyces asoensis TaxID=249586 RepID=UPI0033DA339F
MSAAPTDVIKDFLTNTAPERVQVAADRLVARDATYISLNFSNPELKKIMPWTGTSSGPEAFVSTFARVATYWTIKDFTVQSMFGQDEDVAVFGSFTYQSVATGNEVTSPFAIHAKVRDGKITYFLFMEDTYATARSFSQGGHWTIQSDPAGPAFDVHPEASPS